MKEYYLEEIKQQEQLIDMLKAGYEIKIQELGEKLKESPKIEDAQKTVEIVRLCSKAIKDSEKTLDYLKEEYQKCSGEPYEKHVAKNILLGDRV